MWRRRCLTGLCAALAALVASGSARAADDLLRDGTLELGQAAPESATLERVPVRGPGGSGGDVLRVTVLRPSDPFYGIGLGQTIPAALPEGTRLRLRFRGRSASGNPLRAVVEKAGPPYTSVLETSPVLSRDWKEYRATGTLPAAFPARGLHVRFQMGHQAGVVELADIRLENLGPDPELARARAAVAPDAVAARIRRVRMGDLVVRVVDANGRPVRDADVAIRQTRHAFLFGCNFFGLEPQNSEPWQKAYQQRFTALFNFATLPFYWGAFEPEPGRKDYARLDAMARWCRENGITPKGHPLIWHEVYPAWAPKTPDETIPLLRGRVSEILGHYRGAISIWDVLNEANAAPAFPNGVGAWIKRDGPAPVVATALGWARAASRGANNTLLYNDFDVSDNNLALLTELKKRNALPDAIGIQSHMHGGTWPLPLVWQRTEAFARFGRPIHYTEATVLSGPRRDNVDMRKPPTDWETTPEGERAQADSVAGFYSVLFSHPSVRAITWWDFSDRGAWQNAPAGLLRKDMSPKPAYDRLMRLIKHDWWTDETARTDRNGTIKTRAFYGDHAITVTDARGGRKASATLALPTGSGPRTVTLTLR